MRAKENGRNASGEAVWNCLEFLIDGLPVDWDGFGVFIGIVVVVVLCSFGWKIILRLVDIFSTGGQG